MATQAALLFTLLIIINGCHVARCACSNLTVFSTQLDTLLAEYEREVPPAAPALITLTLDVRHATVDERASSVRLLADLRMTWSDKRLAWNATDWGCESALAAAERLWLPDVALVNAAAYSGGDAPLRARITSAGAVAWIARLDLTVPLAMELRDWPNDVQTSTFIFGSRGHTIDEVDLEINDFKYVTVWESGAWEILSVIGSKSTWDEGAGSTGADGVGGVGGAGGAGVAGGSRRLAAWRVSLRRRAGARALAAGAVFAAAALLLLAALLLPPAARAPLCASAAFTTAMWLTSASLRLPGGASCPLALSLSCALCVCAAGAGAGGALAWRLARCSTPPPRALRALLAAAPACCGRAPDEASPPAESGAWAAAARLLDNTLRAAFAATLLLLVCLYL